MKTNPIPASLYQFLTGKSPYRIDRKRDPIKIIFNNNSGPNNRAVPKYDLNLTSHVHRLLTEALTIDAINDDADCYLLMSGEFPGFARHPRLRNFLT